MMIDAKIRNVHFTYLRGHVYSDGKMIRLMDRLSSVLDAFDKDGIVVRVTPGKRAYLQARFDAKKKR